MFKEEPTGYDIIGDIHGHCEALETLLKKLGYVNDGTCYRHAERKAIFVGDLIDRGPKIRETLALVKAMHDQDQALITLGNHEYNAICYSSKEKKEGMFLRPHIPKNYNQFLATSDAFGGLSHRQPDLLSEWEKYVAWFKRLPLFLDMGDFKVVHACWSQRHINLIGNQKLSDYDFLFATANDAPVTPEFLAVETILKGPEIRLPRGHEYTDKDGTVRSKMRAKWWDDHIGATYRGLSFPNNDSIPDDVIGDKFDPYWDIYPKDAPPVFVGHYWLPPQKPEPFGNVICLDYSVAKDGFATAYQWEPNSEISPNNFVTSH